MSKAKEKGALYFLFAAILAVFLGWLYWKHRELAARIGLGGQIETVRPQIQTTLIEPQESVYMGAPL